MAEKIQAMEALVEELMKNDPCEDSIREFMGKVGLSYTSDPIERMSQVLIALHSQPGIDSAGAEGEEHLIET